MTDGSVKKSAWLRLFGFLALIVAMDLAVAAYVVMAFFYLKPCDAGESLLFVAIFLVSMLGISLLGWLAVSRLLSKRGGASRERLIAQYAMVHCSSLVLLCVVPFYLAFPNHPLLLGYARVYFLVLWGLAVALFAVIAFAREGTLSRGEGFLSCNYKTVVLFLVVVYTLATFCLSLVKYRHFGGYSEDAAHFAQIFYHCTIGEFKIVSLQGKNLMGIHFSPLLYLFVPFYYLFPYPPTVFFLRSLLVSLSAVPLYLILRHRFISLVTFSLILAYLFFPALVGLTVGDFHASECAPFFMLFSFYFFGRERFGPFLLFLLLSLCVKGGNIPLVLYFYSPYAWLKKMSGKWVVFPLLICIPWFFIATSVSPGQDWYRPVVTANIINNLTSVKHLLFHLGQKRELGLIYSYLHPLGFVLPWLSVESLFALPWLLVVWLMGGNPQVITWHYAITVPFAFLAVARTVEKIKSRLTDNRITIALVVLLLFFSLSYVPIWLRPEELRATPQQAALEEALRLVPSDASVLVPQKLAVNVAHRKKIFTERSFRRRDPGEGVDFIIFDSNMMELYYSQVERGINLSPFTVKLAELAPARRDFGQFSLMWGEDGVYIYRNRGYATDTVSGGAD